MLFVCKHPSNEGRHSFVFMGKGKPHKGRKKKSSRGNGDLMPKIRPTKPSKKRPADAEEDADAELIEEAATSPASAKKPKRDPAGGKAVFRSSSRGGLFPSMEHGLLFTSDQPDDDDDEEKKVGNDNDKDSDNDNDNDNDNETGKERNNFRDSKLLHRVALLSLSDMHVGMTLLGAVKQIKTLELAISLPNGMLGIVPATEISDEFTARLQAKIDVEADADADAAGANSQLSELFAVGQLVHTVVTDVRRTPPNTRIELSLKPSRFNPPSLLPVMLSEGTLVYGAVRSVEEHGYVVSLGAAGGVSGFLRHQNVSSDVRLHVGQPLSAVVIGTGRVLQLSAQFPFVSRATVSDTEHTLLSFDALRAGMLVQCRVTNVIQQPQPALRVNVLGSFQGVVDPFHVPPGQNYRLQQRLRARVIYVDAERHRLGLSLLPHIVQFTACSFAPELSFATRVRVQTRRVDRGVGALFELYLPTEKEHEEEEEEAREDMQEEAQAEDVDGEAEKEDGKEGRSVGTKLRGFGYAILSRLSDEPLSRVEDKCTVSSVHRAKVIGFNHFEGLVNLSLRRSALEQPFDQYTDVEPGALVNCHVLTIGPMGLLVQLSPSVRGLVPLTHLSDVSLARPEKFFTVGQQLRARVLDVDAERHRVRLTVKRSLVRSRLPIVTGYDQLHEQMLVHGYVLALKPHGLIVALYNGVCGYVPHTELGLSTAHRSLAEVFQVGQVVKARVLAVQPAQQQLKLSLHTKPTEQQLLRTEALQRYTPGDVLSEVTVQRIEETGVVVRVRKHLEGFVHDYHLGDFPEHYAALKAQLQVGAKLADVLVLEKHRVQQRLLLSCKPSLLRAVRTGQFRSFLDALQQQQSNPSDADALSSLWSGTVLPGFVHSCTDAHGGVFVHFVGELSGLASKVNQRDLLSMPEGKYAPGLSVRARVLSSSSSSSSNNNNNNNTEENLPKLRLSLKPTDVLSTDSQTFLQSFLAERHRLTEHTGLPLIGSVHTVRVTAVLPVGALTAVPLSDESESADWTAVVLPPHCRGVSWAVGRRLPAVVLDVDPLRRIADLSFRPELLAAVQNNTQQAKDQLFLDAAEQDLHLNAVVLLIRDKYLVVSVPQYSGLCAVLPVSDWNLSVVADPHRAFAIDQRLRVVCPRLSADDEELVRELNRLVLRFDGGIGAALNAVVAHGAADSIAPVPVPAEPSASSSSASQQYREGTVVRGRIEKITATELRLSVAPDVRGRVHITEVFDAPPLQQPSPPGTATDAVSKPTTVFDRFRVGDVVSGWVLALKERHADRFLPLSHTSPRVVSRSLDITLRPPSVPRVHSYADLHVGQLIPAAIVTRLHPQWLELQLAARVRGRVHVLETADSVAELQNRPLLQRFVRGQVLLCRVLRRNGATLELTLRQLDESQPMVSVDSLAAGQQLNGVVVSVLSAPQQPPALVVQLAPQCFGRVHCCDVSDQFEPRPMQAFRRGQFVRCFVLEVHNNSDGNRGSSSDALPLQPSRRIDLSLRQSRLSGSVAAPLPEIESLQQLHDGLLVCGYVKQCVPKKGCFVALSRHVDARVLLSELSDTFVRDPEKEFFPGRLVMGRITAVDSNAQHADLSLKRSSLLRHHTLLFADLHEGRHVNGVISAVKQFGLFVRLEHSRLSGLCHRTEVCDAPTEPPEDLSTLYQVGDYVRCRVLRVRPEKRTVSLSIKPSWFANESADSSSGTEFAQQPLPDAERLIVERYLEQTDDGGEKEKKADGQEKEETGEESMEALSEQQLEQLIAPEEDDEEEGEKDDNELQEDAVTDQSSVSAMPAVGFGWEEPDEEQQTSNTKKRKADTDAHTDLGTADSDERPSGKSRSAKRLAQQRREAETAAREAELLLEDRRPETAADFDRLLLAAPNSSFLWIKYVAHHLAAGAVEAARVTAEKALATIHYREERERLNMWVALLNLENVHGTHDSLMRVFERALAVNDPKTVHFHLLDIFERAENWDMTESVYRAMLRKFKDSEEVWQKYLESKFRQQKLDEARALLARSLQSLPTRSHIGVVSKFAQLEFRHGSTERGRTVFEELLAAHPKRLDLWNVYVDQEQRVLSGVTETDRPAAVARVRRLLERCCSLPMSTKKAKHCFRRYLHFERQWGDVQSAQHVKDLAAQYLDAKLKADDAE